MAHSASTPRPRAWSGDSLALVAGALVSLSLAPFELWLLGPLAAGLLAWLIADTPPAATARRGWLFGVGLFGAGTSWVYVSIHVYGHAAPWLAGLLTVLFCLGLGLLVALPAYIYARWLRPLPAGQWLGFAVFWVLTEWLRGWLLTGFPWLYLGYAHLDTPLAGWAPIAGVLGIGFVLALTGAVVAQWIRQRRAPRLALALTSLLWLAGPLLSWVEWTAPAPRAPLDIALVQANIPQELKWNPHYYRATLDAYDQLSRALWADSDIVIWPEAAIPGFYQQARDFLAQQARHAADHDVTLILGIPWRDGEGVYYNSAVALGAGNGLYHKRRLVPFGEYVPLEHWLRGLIAFFDLPMSNFQSGPALQAPLMAGDVSLSVALCYEIVYPDLVAAGSGADLLLTLSNDAWFGHSIGPHQHFQMARMRALENGRWLVRATGSGVTGIVDHRGQVRASLPQFQTMVLHHQAEIRTGRTPFGLAGSLPLIAVCGVMWGGMASRRWMSDV